MATVVIASYDVANFPEGGGHFWVYMQYALALRLLGCDTYWLESFRGSGDEARDALALATFVERMERFGLGEKLVVYKTQNKSGSGEPREYVGMTSSAAESIFRRADLLLNFHYVMDPALLSCFRRTALVDLDPGLLQLWIAAGQLSVQEHDYYLTIGETVGTPAASFPDLGHSWRHVRPPICLDRWRYVYDPRCAAFTTISTWRGHDWLAIGGQLFENTKGASFLRFAQLPRLTPQALELSLSFGPKDGADRRYMEHLGWRMRHSREVASTPEAYQSYIQLSRGEFGCAKPYYVKYQTAWVSDRTLCYLASGKPVVVQNTGPSAFLPSGEGMFRFSTIEEAVDALATVNADYRRHCRAAREIVETYFDGKRILQGILDLTLG